MQIKGNKTRKEDLSIVKLSNYERYEIYYFNDYYTASLNHVLELISEQ
jgi:hypothetical protein